LKSKLTRNEPTERGVDGDFEEALERRRAQPFRVLGKGLPSRGGGPRLTDRKYYK
jgi:hypothetical protein